MTTRRFDLTYSIVWNLLLITVGTVILTFGLKGIVVQHQFVSSGLFGLALLTYYGTGWLSPGVLYFLLNIPMFFLAWKFVGRRFFFYSLYAMVAAALMYELIDVDFHIVNELYAAVAAGVLTGAGGGIVLRSLGSNGGLDVLAVMLTQRYNIGVGKVYFLWNSVLFSASLFTLPVDLVIVSLILAFISAGVVEYVLAMFNQRKMVLIVSEHATTLAQDLFKSMKLGATFLAGRGAYSGNDKNILMTVINNVQLKRLEQLVFERDESALMIVENTFNVMGKSFARRRLY